MKKFVKDWSQSYLISILQKTLDVGTCITYILTHSVTEALEILVDRLNGQNAV